MTRFVTLVTAAGKGRRLGADKALVELDGLTAIERIVRAHRRAGAAQVVVVRQVGAAALPEGLDAAVVAVEAAEMIDSVRAGWRALLADDPSFDHVLVHPVDYPMVGDATLRELCAYAADRRAASGPERTRIVLPLCGERTGHPLVFDARLVDELCAPTCESLRHVLHADPARVAVVPVDDPWVLRDLDLPRDVAAARAYLARPRGDASLLMRRHRSRREFYTDDVPTPAQLAWFVDSARFASTSSWMQAYSVVAVRDAARRAKVAELCAGQEHVRQAPVFLAICADLHRIARACEQAGAKFEADSLEVFLQSTIDAALVGQNILLAAEAEGLGGCMIGAARNHPVSLARLLELPAHVYVAFGLVLGRPSDDPIPRGRLPLGAVLHEEQYDVAGTDAAIVAVDEVMRGWARRCNAERGGYGGKLVDEHRGWSHRMVWLWGRASPQKGRAALAAELRELSFGLRLDPPSDAVDETA